LYKKVLIRSLVPSALRGSGRSVPLSKLFIAAAAAAAITACSEKLEGGASCPLLCAQQSATLMDTTIDGVVFDTTVVGLPPIGAERLLMLASHGDSLDARAIVRFDTIPQSFVAGTGLDSVIVKLDTAMLVLPILRPDSAHRPVGPITIEAYNVDSIPADSVTLPTDTVSSVIATLFSPARLLATKTFAPESLLDTLRIPLPTDSVLDRITNGTSLRIGFRLVPSGSEGYNLQLGSTQVAAPVTLHLVPSIDSGAVPVDVTPLSKTPFHEEFLAGPLADYSIVVKGGSSAVSSNVIGVGGVPSRRALIRFDVPSRIIDSTTVVRATLLLTQTPNRQVSSRDSVYVFPAAVLASSAITDTRTLLQFVGGIGQFGLDSVAMAPVDSGLRSFEIVSLVRTWRGTTPDISPRAVALRSNGEGGSPGEIDFFSFRVGGAVRPRLRITYVPQTSFGLP
jgi:hypothetical protein